MRVRTASCAFCALAVSAASAHAQLTFEFTAGPGLIALGGSDPVKAAGIMAGVTSAASKWSSIVGDTATLKYTIDYDAGLPALGASFDVYDPKTYAGVKTALVAKASSPFDGSATAHLQPGPTLSIWINDLFAPPMLPPHIDADGSPNNAFIDISRAHLKGLGMLPPDDGGPGAEGTLKFGSAAFDFDPSDGITSGTYDFVGVAMHEIAHSMGFISGVDTLSTLLPTGISPPGPVETTPMVTVLDLFRYSMDSFLAGPLVPDMSLPVPGFSPMRYFSIDGGMTSLDTFSTGIGLAGDGEQAGHWKLDGTFGLMDPELAAGFELTAAFEALLLGPPPPPDLIALDVIGWTIIPAPGSASVLIITGVILSRRRR